MKVENRIIFIFGSIVVALVIIIVFSVRSIDQYSKNAQKIAHSREVAAALSANFILMQDVETGMRGYIITGKPKFLEPYYSAVENLEANIKLLRKLNNDSPLQLKRIDTLAQLSKQKIALSKENILLRQIDGFEEAIKRVSTEKGKSLMDNIRAVNLRMQKEENLVLDDNILASGKSLTKTYRIVVFGGAFSILIIILLMFFIRRTLILKRALTKSKEHAEELVGFKDQFLSNMSHEIRTPMNAIIGFTKVVLKTDLTSKQREYLSAIKKSGDSLILLINDILDLAKVDAGRMVFERVPFKMAISISDMLHLFEIKMQEKNLKLIKEYDPQIPQVLLGDPLRLHQVILNLMSNAVKFTSQGHITFSARMLNEDEEHVTVEFAVADTGMGIAENKMGKIFENFQQATTGTSRLYGGTGLGLAIVKQLVEAQGGTVSVKSKIDEGSVFSFVLNFQKTLAEVEPEIEIINFNIQLTKIKVLVVEDIALNQLLLKTILDDYGFEHDFAENGLIAIKKLETNTYDIILMDLLMPEMNGFEATEYIRDKMKSTVPIIALTADVTTVDLAKCQAVGMDDYIAKPLDEKLLYSKIVGLVKKNIDLFEPEVTEESEKGSKCINLDHLRKITKSNPLLMAEMISLYLEQTPPLISTMKQSMRDNDLNSLYSAVHKMLPSFSIVGIDSEIEKMARKIQDYARTQQPVDGIPDMVTQLTDVCTQACIELRKELNLIRSSQV